MKKFFILLFILFAIPVYTSAVSEFKIISQPQQTANINIARKYYNLGMENSHKRDYTEALNNFNKAVSYGLNNEDIYFKIALLKTILRDYDGAIEDCEKILAKNPNSEVKELYKHLKDIKNELKNKKRLPHPSTKRNHTSQKFLWPIILVFCFICVFILGQKKEETEEQYIPEWEQRRQYESRQRSNIEKSIRINAIPYDSIEQPKKPELQNFCLDEDIYNFADNYERMSIEEQMEIDLPANYFTEKGIYYRYYAYNLAVDLYEQNIRLYKIKLENSLKQPPSHWEKYWREEQQNPLEFTIAIIKLYENLGYKVSVAKDSDYDFIDFILYKDNVTTIVKCESGSQTVDLNEIKCLNKLKNDFNAKNAIFVSYSGFTKDAKVFAEKSNIELLDVDDLIKLSIEANQQNDN